MSLIEGIGDEVTFILGGLLLCIILMFAWLSTHTADIPLLREVGVIVVEFSQRRSRTQNAVSEERVIRDGTDASIERESTSVIDERQQYETVQRTGETSNSHVIVGSISENNIAIGVHNSASPTSDDRVGLPTRTTSEVSFSSGIVPEHAETISNTSDQTDKTGASHLAKHKSGDQIPSESLQESETLIPKASVIVDDSKGFAYPNGEEIRQRRVQYFQANKSTEGASEEANSHTDDKSSDFTSTDIEHTKLLKVDSHSNSHPQENLATTSGTSYQATAVDSSNIASGSPQEDNSDSQTVNEQEGSTSSKIRVKLKYMNETQRLVYAEPMDTIGDFRRAHFQAELQDNKWVRFIYNGQDLRDDARTLQACNIGDNCTMHCLITPQTQPNPINAVAVEEDEDSFMGAMMYPLFTVIILIVWYFRFTYRQYFSAMSTVCLIGISFLLALSYISSLRTSDRIPPQRRLGPNTPPAPGVRLREQHQHVD